MIAMRCQSQRLPALEGQSWGGDIGGSHPSECTNWLRQDCVSGPCQTPRLLKASCRSPSKSPERESSSMASRERWDFVARSRRASCLISSERGTDRPSSSARHSAAWRARAVRRFPPSEGRSMICTDSSSPSGSQPSGAWFRSGPRAQARHQVRRRTLRGRPIIRSSACAGKRQGPISGTTTSVRNDQIPSSAASAGTMSMCLSSSVPHGRSKACVDPPKGFG